MGSDTEDVDNRPPELTAVKLVPQIFRPGDILGVEASATDPDGDEVSIQYEWSFNDEMAGSSNRLDVPLKRGDKFSVRVTPFDGQEYGRYVMLRKEIVNMPPLFLQTEKAVFDGETYRCQFMAEDPDGDTLTYSLKSGPTGMKISPTTGLTTWKVPEDFTGLAKISVVAEDGHDGKTQYDLNVTIKQEESES